MYLYINNAFNIILLFLKRIVVFAADATLASLRLVFKLLPEYLSHKNVQEIVVFMLTSRNNFSTCQWIEGGF